MYFCTTLNNHILSWYCSSECPLIIISVNLLTLLEFCMLLMLMPSPSIIGPSCWNRLILEVACLLQLMKKCSAVSSSPLSHSWHTADITIWRLCRWRFSTNYHACIVMPTWYRCAPSILFWPWPPYYLLPRSCLTWIFFCRFSLMGTTLCAASSKKKLCLFNKIFCMYCTTPTWCRCAASICFDLDLHLTCSQGDV